MAMAAVLETVPVAAVEPVKAKPRHGSRGSASSAPNEAEPLAGAGFAAPNDIQISAGVGGAAGEGEQISSATVSQALTEGPSREREKRSSKRSEREKEKERPAVVTREDFATAAAKAKAEKALLATPGFASREDAALWLRSTLQGDPALENLEAAYDQEVNANLPSDSDKLLDHAASIKRQLARSQVQLLPETWTGWQPSPGELPGLLLSIALLCLGAPLCFNLLKRASSLVPLAAFSKEEKRA